MINPTFRILRYTTLGGKQPYTAWLENLKDRNGVSLIRLHVERMGYGYFSKSRLLVSGIWELKINYGPGYRVYYLRDGKDLVVLIMGGNKGSQDRDIYLARKYGDDYWRRK